MKPCITDTSANTNTETAGTFGAETECSAAAEQETRKRKIDVVRKQYGLPYQGSKTLVAKWIVEQLPSAETFVDLFAGGCAVTHAAILSGKFNRFVLNDITPFPSYFISAATGNVDIENVTPPSSQEFKRNIGKNPLLDLCFSFGSTGNDYLYSLENESIKLYAEKLILEQSEERRRLLFRKFATALTEYFHETGTIPPGLETLKGVERLARVFKLRNLRPYINASEIVVTQLDYRNVPIPPNSTVYADPPYARTKRYGKQRPFNTSAFSIWLESTPFPVFVSEYTLPKCCKQINEIEVLKKLCGNTGKHRTERLGVQKRFFDEVVAKTNPELFKEHKK